jgi:hypothetical protein
MAEGGAVAAYNGRSAHPPQRPDRIVTLDFAFPECHAQLSSLLSYVRCISASPSAAKPTCAVAVRHNSKHTGHLCISAPIAVQS